MNKLMLVLPSMKYEDMVMKYKDEFILNNEFMHGTAGLDKFDTFEQWYEKIVNNSDEETVLEGLVPASTYLAISIDDGRLLGMIDIRHRLNEYLLKFGGHIGYSIKKSERRNGYATEMLFHALKKCEKLKIKKVLITCDKDNIPSAKTIINNGGILENEVLGGKHILQRYWINLA